MAEDHGDAGATTGDVVELQGAVTTDEVKDIGGVHGGAGKLATAADVEKEVAVSASVLPEQKVTASSGAVHPDTPDAQHGEEQEEDDGWAKKRKLAFTGFDPYDPEYSDNEEYEYDSGEDVYKGNFASFTAKEVKKITKELLPSTTARSRSGAAPTAPPSQSQRMAASITLCLMQRMSRFVGRTT
ncbi:hypothetical protein D1007_17607 [Hordeum vulgare]|nr:hypothetical protein D1007_17607 [Hordeum vulgare]